MALTDRIAALVTAIATAFNSRIQNPVSGYDIAVLNGYTGTQAQWLAGLIPQPTPQLPVPQIVERFDALASGAAWPARWTSRLNSGVTAAVDAAQRGGLTLTAASIGGRQSLEAMTTMGEHGVVVKVRTSVSSSGSVAVSIDGSGTDLTSYSGAVPANCYWAILNFGSGRFLLGKGNSNFVVGSSPTLAANTDYMIRLERVGTYVRAKLWLATAVEPEAWTLGYDFADATPLTGFVSIGAYTVSGNAVPVTIAVDDLLVYGLEEIQATAAVPGLVALATAAEVATGTEVRKALTPALLTPYRGVVFSAFADLGTLAAAAPIGTVALCPVSTLSDGTLQPSYWRLAGDRKFQPLVPLRCATPASVVGKGSLYTFLAQYTAIKLEPYESTISVIRDGSNPVNGYDEYIYVGTTTGFILWRGNFGFTPGSKYNLDGRMNRGSVDGQMVRSSFAVSNISGQAAARDDILWVPGGTFITPGTTAPFIAGGAQNNDNSWLAAAFWVDSSGQIRLLSNPPQTATAAGAAVFDASGIYPRNLPTA